MSPGRKELRKRRLILRQYSRYSNGFYLRYKRSCWTTFGRYAFHCQHQRHLGPSGQRWSHARMHGFAELLMDHDSEGLYKLSHLWSIVLSETPGKELLDLGRLNDEILEFFINRIKKEKTVPSLTLRLVTAFTPARRSPRFLSSWQLNPAFFWLWLREKDLSSECVRRDTWQTCRLRSCSSALAAIASANGKVHRSRYEEVFLPGWRQILLQAIELDGLGQLGTSSPLASFVFNRHTSKSLWALDVDRISETIELWMHELLAAGMTNEALRRYCEHERQIWSQGLLGENYDFEYFKSDEMMRGIRAICPPSESIWLSCHVWISWPLDETAGEFWATVEDVAPTDGDNVDNEEAIRVSMPGAWKEEKDHGCWAKVKHVRFFYYCQDQRCRRQARRVLRQIRYFELGRAECECCERAEWAIHQLLIRAYGNWRGLAWFNSYL